MATIRKRINPPITNPLTLQNIRSAASSNKQILMPFPGSNELLNVGQQIGATVADPLGFKATIDGLQSDISAGIPGFLVGAAVLIVGVLLIYTGLQAFVLPAAGKAIGTIAKAAV
jgi:hypothetical protein